VLRVLGNALGLTGFDQASSEEVLAELQATMGSATAAAGSVSAAAPAGASGIAASAAPSAAPSGAAAGAALPWVEVPPYQTDVLVRGSEPLAKTKDGQLARAVI
jgi:hypothetical protein